MDKASHLGNMRRCFFCLKKSGFETELQTQSRYFSLQSLLHYLGIPNSWVKFDQKPVFTCELCSELLEKFRNLFHLWQKIEMGLGVCLQQIGNQIQSGSGTASPDHFSLKTAEIWRTNEELRKRIQQHCTD